MPTTRYDVWMANLGPSEKLLRTSRHAESAGESFPAVIEQNCSKEGGIDKRNKTIKNHGQKFTLRFLQRVAKGRAVTLMCHCRENEPHCHRHILGKLLKGKV